MATIKDLMDKAARDCSIVPPAAWTSATQLTHVALKDRLNETIDEMLDRVDWPSPISDDVTITGTGAETYDLPADFLRLPRDDSAIYEQTKTRRQGVPVVGNGVWTFLQDWGNASGDRFYRLQGDESNGRTISFFRDLTSSDNVVVSYVSKNWMQTAGGAIGYEWTNESDELLLPRRIVELGIAWRFRKRKGLPWADELSEYELRLTRAANDYRSVRVIDMGGYAPRNPFDIPPPDYIPPP